MKIGVADLRSFCIYSQLLSFKTPISQLLRAAAHRLPRESAECTSSQHRSRTDFAARMATAKPLLRQLYAVFALRYRQFHDSWKQHSEIIATGSSYLS
ncbi:MAG: hypothetical protein Q8R06_05890 [Polaromonas sp.]|uniref:hypothetical protein n=1 Tax=Polaromonas sp. TaxID=1869339 RepID=UPI002737650B|nr:hypothetical protein [Polaromonas sp.]MDP3796668.1 hypothetical protein [Polaromonas sp.]